MKYNLFFVENKDYLNDIHKEIKKRFISGIIELLKRRGNRILFKDSLESLTEGEYLWSDCMLIHPNKDDYGRLHELRNKYPNVGLVISPRDFSDFICLSKNNGEEDIQVLEDEHGVVMLEKLYSFENFIKIINKAVENTRGAKE